MRTPDYTHGVPGLLLEGERTNLAPNTEDFTQAAWLKQLLSVSASGTASPSGGACQILTPSGSDAAITMVNTPASAAAMTFSVWLRSRTGSDVSLTLRVSRDSPFSSVASSVITVTTSWQRFSLTAAPLDTTSHSWRIGAGSTWSTGENLDAWGAQLEAGAYPTSYIPNPGTGTMLRVADVAPITGTEFTDHFAAADVGCTYVLDIRFGGIAAGVFPSALYINNGLTHGMPHTLYVTSDPSNSTYLLGDAVSNATIAVTPFTRHKIAFSYKGARRSIAVNGSAVVTDNSNVFTGVASTTMRLAHVAGGTSVAESMTVYSIRVIKGVETTGAALQALSA